LLLPFLHSFIQQLQSCRCSVKGVGSKEQIRRGGLGIDQLKKDVGYFIRVALLQAIALLHVGMICPQIIIVGDIWSAVSLNTGFEPAEKSGCSFTGNRIDRTVRGFRAEAKSQKNELNCKVRTQKALKYNELRAYVEFLRREREMFICRTHYAGIFPCRRLKNEKNSRNLPCNKHQRAFVQSQSKALLPPDADPLAIFPEYYRKYF